LGRERFSWDDAGTLRGRAIVLCGRDGTEMRASPRRQRGSSAHVPSQLLRSGSVVGYVSVSSEHVSNRMHTTVSTTRCTIHY
jgi:hypothetical protein